MRFFFCLSILSMLALKSTSQVQLVWKEDAETPALSKAISSANQARILDFENFQRLWRVFSIKNQQSPDAYLNGKVLRLDFYLDEYSAVESVAYSMTSYRRDGSKMIRLVYPQDAVQAVIDSIQLGEKLNLFSEYLKNKSSLLSAKEYTLYVGNIGDKLNTKGIKKWDKLKSTSRPDTVKKLNFSNFKIYSLPTELQRFVNLEELDLSNNYLTSIPKDVFKLKKLKVLNLSNNALNENALQLKRNKSIEVLNIQKNDFGTLPKKLKKVKKLDFLIAGKNPLKGVQSYKFQKLKKLTKLNLYNASLEGLPPKVYTMENLEELDLYYNRIKVLEGDIKRWKKLKVLALSYNGLYKLPDEMYELTQLETLYAHHNLMDRLPVLPQSLKLLDIGYNSFGEFPIALTRLINLKELDFNGNQLGRAVDMTYLPQNLKTLFISSNPLFIEPAHEEEKEAFLKLLEKRNIEVR